MSRIQYTANVVDKALMIVVMEFLSLLNLLLGGFQKLS